MYYNISFLLIILCFNFELTISNNTALSWSDYKKINDLEFMTIEENHYRRKVYMENLAKIEEHNEKFKKGLVSYSMVMNEFGHLTEKEFLETHTNPVSSEGNFKKLDNRFYYNNPKNVTLPAAVDWRLRGAVTPVTRQKRCGSCYAFAVVGALESHYKIKFKKTINLSKQQLMDCGKKYNLFGCKKGSTKGAFDYAMKIGLTTESQYPYEALSGNCRLGGLPIKMKLKSYKKVKQESVYDMQAAVAFEGPVTALVNAKHLEFLSGKEVLIDNWCINRTANHAVIVVGYNTTPEGLNYWIIKNSWGTNWGDNGYFYLQRRKDDLCGLTHFTYIPYVK